MVQVGEVDVRIFMLVRMLYVLPESLPVLIPAIHTEDVVGCIGGISDNEHEPLLFRCCEGFLCRCGECDQIFMLVRKLYELPEMTALVGGLRVAERECSQISRSCPFGFRSSRIVSLT